MLCVLFLTTWIWWWRPLFYAAYLMDNWQFGIFIVFLCVKNLVAGYRICTCMNTHLIQDKFPFEGVLDCWSAGKDWSIFQLISGAERKLVDSTVLFSFHSTYRGAEIDETIFLRIRRASTVRGTLPYTYTRRQSDTDWGKAYGGLSGKCYA